MRPLGGTARSVVICGGPQGTARVRSALDVGGTPLGNSDSATVMVSRTSCPVGRSADRIAASDRTVIAAVMFASASDLRRYPTLRRSCRRSVRERPLSRPAAERHGDSEVHTLGLFAAGAAGARSRRAVSVPTLRHNFSQTRRVSVHNRRRSGINAPSKSTIRLWDFRRPGQAERGRRVYAPLQ
jgi:hypothetical protein